MNSPIIMGPDGKPVFVGTEDPNNTPPDLRKDTSNKMECPQCHGMFAYLVGENTHDGGKQGCESCYRAPQTPPTKGVENYNKELEII